MPRPLRSSAFPNGYVSLTPSDPDEAYFSDHANLVAWISGSGLSLREIDNLWDDLAKPTLSYRTAGTIETGAKPGAAFGNRPTIRIAGAAARLIGSLTLPASITVVAAFKLDTPAVSQTILGGPVSTFPRFLLGTNATGYPQLVFNAPGSSVPSTAQGVIPANTPSILWATMDDASKLVRIGLNNNNYGANATVTEGHASPAGVGVGALVDGTSPTPGMDVSDILIFNTVLSDADRGRLLAFLSRRTGIVVANLPPA